MAHIFIHEASQEHLKEMYKKDNNHERKIVLDCGAANKTEYMWTKLLKIGEDHQADMVNGIDPSDRKYKDFSEPDIIKSIQHINPANGKPSSHLKFLINIIYY